MDHFYSEKYFFQTYNLEPEFQASAEILAFENKTYHPFDFLNLKKEILVLKLYIVSVICFQEAFVESYGY